MTREQIRGIIVNLLAEIAPDDDIRDLDDNVFLRDQLDIDSMDFLEIILEIRKRYQIEVPEVDYEEFRTLNGAVAYLLPKMPP